MRDLKEEDSMLFPELIGTIKVGPIIDLEDEKYRSKKFTISTSNPQPIIYGNCFHII